MRKYKPFLSCFYFFTCFWASAQTPDASYQQRYNAAQSFLKGGNNTAAFDAFSSLANSVSRNDLVPFAQYYYALSALRLERTTEAKRILFVLRQNYPNWIKMEDTNYLLADISFREKQYDLALNYLMPISTAALRRDADDLERYYIGQIKEINVLKTLSQQYPNDRIIAQITNKPIINNTASSPPLPNNNFKRGFYTVAAMLPFKIADFDIGQRDRNNQFSYDLYEGMKWAQAKLQQEGIKTNLMTYDIGNDIKATTDVLNSAGFQQSELVFGPLYNEPAKLVADYVEANKGYMVQPTALTNDLLLNHSRTFLTHSTFENQAASIFQFMTIQNATLPKKIAIFYNATRRDSLLAGAFRDKAQSAGFEVIDYRKVREKIDSTTSINDRNKPSFVFLSSSNDNDGGKVLAMLTKKRTIAPLFSTSSAFDLTKISEATFLGREVFLLNNDFMDSNKPQVKDFQKQFFAARNTLPSTFVMQGYDMMLFYGRMIHKHKSNLRAGLDLQNTQDDYLLQGFDYVESGDNKAIKIIKIEDSRFVVVNNE